MTMLPQSSLLSGVSCETIQRLKRFNELVLRWNASINLVSPTTLEDLWGRHIVDSAQIFPHIPSNVTQLLDLGSGGGFPAVVLAVLSKELSPHLSITMAESDQRKAAFLRTAIRELGLSARVVAQRIETMPKQTADVITARALAPLQQLLPLAIRHAAPGARLIFPKGARWREELNALEVDGKISTMPSETAPESALVIIDLTERRYKQDPDVKKN